MKKLKHLKGACAVLAVHYVSMCDEDTAIRICTLYGYRPELGTPHKGWLDAAKHLGVRTREITRPLISLCEFIEGNPKGVFFIFTQGHLFVVDNGILVDPRFDNPSMRRIVLRAWRVLDG